MAGPLAEQTPWPVAPWGGAYDVWAENDAWFTGDVAAIEKVTRRPERATHLVKGEPHRGGVRGAVASARRRFWGEPVDPESQEVRLHIPAPADVASLSADLLFAAPPDIYYPQQAATPGSQLQRPDGTLVQPQVAAEQGPSLRSKRLELLASSPLAQAAYLEAGAFASAFGASAFRLVWDQETADHVWFEPVAPDVTIPEFRYGRLSAISFWTAFKAGAQLIYRHVERHEVGAVLHTLYLGTERNLGRIVRLQDRPETAPLADLPGARFDGQTLVLETGIRRLTAAWWINQPARAWRRQGDLAEAGRSDYAGGVLGLFDALDGAWSSWVNDLDLGRARLIVPSAFLASAGPGQGASFDRGRSLYSPVSAPGSAGGALSDSIEQVQFDIRVAEHQQTTSALMAAILSSVGLGDDDQAAQQIEGDRTATEVLAGGKKQDRTRGRKALYAQMALTDLLQSAMLLDGAKFPGKGGGDYDPPVIEFPEAAQIDPVAGSQVIANLRGAKVLSVWEGVARANPTWKDQDIQREVDRLREEGQIADPATVGNPAQDPAAAARNLPSVEDAARQLGLQVTGG